MTALETAALPLLLPLRWETGSFSALRTEAGAPHAPCLVCGKVSGPFGIYRGQEWIGKLPHLPAPPGFTLVHRPTGRSLLHLRRLKACKAAAEELAGLSIPWHSSKPEDLTGPDDAKVREVFRRYRNLDLSPEMRERLRLGSSSGPDRPWP